MKFTYLHNLSWEALTREERYYCAEFFFYFRSRPVDLVKFLLNHHGKTIGCLTTEDLNDEWELGYEVCFYRDFIFRHNRAAKERIDILQYNPKRTFDLCLFSPSKILIIEAKVQQQFDVEQLGQFAIDKTQVVELIERAGYVAPSVEIVGLGGSGYFQNVVKYGRDRCVPDVIRDNYFTWKDVYEWTGLEVFKKADSLYKDLGEKNKVIRTSVAEIFIKKLEA